MNITTAATTPPAAAAPTMKLLVDTGTKRVVFAEAGKDVVDFILGLLAMPLGVVNRLLVAKDDGGALGSIGNVHASLEKMDALNMQSTGARDALLIAAPEHHPFQLSFVCVPSAATSSRYQPQLSTRADTSTAGFVQGVATYTIMDDLTVTPTSGISSVALLKDLDAVEERTVNIGHHQALGIIKAALHSKSVLTDALLVKKN
ncbi:hypothetical protein QOZ80_1BG0058720 [Eleusine coracana subsp. coracana]|nr:hypothetical protein QOZ80_1BG0058720 [Eleusine coracana subsp. coracana]